MSNNKKKNQEEQINLEKIKKKNKLHPCKENALITNDGEIRESVGVSDKAQILME
jgi:hypothetical protein